MGYKEIVSKRFILPDRGTVRDKDIDTNTIGLQTHFVGIGVGAEKCEHTKHTRIYFLFEIISDIYSSFALFIFKAKLVPLQQQTSQSWLDPSYMAWLPCKISL